MQKKTTTAKTKFKSPTKADKTPKKGAVSKKTTPKKRTTKSKVASKIKVTPEKKTKKTATPKSKTVPKKTQASQIKKAKPKRPTAKAKITNAAGKQKKSKTVPPKTQVRKKVKASKKVDVSKIKRKTSGEVKNIKKVRATKNPQPETVEKKTGHKPFLSDVVKKRGRVKKKKEPVEETDTGNYLFEKTTRKKRGRRRVIKPVGSAIFRGKRLTYSFDVFDLKEKFEDFPAVFVISERRIDREGRGHHKIVCIGQTEKLGKEVSKHKKLASVKKSKANVVSILKDDFEKNRLTIEENLKTSYSVLCSHK